jgi:ABC-type taurine transport system ATPase subunit
MSADLTPALVPLVLDDPARRAGALLAIDGLGKTFGSGAGQVQALSPTDLYVQEGDFLCVVGPSGCGKTTLLNLVAGFERPTAGQVRLRGQRITGPGAERGVVFQQGALFNWMTVLENVAFGPRACGVAPEAARSRAESQIQMPKDSTVITTKAVGLSRAAFFAQRTSSPTVPLPPTCARS